MGRNTVCFYWPFSHFVYQCYLFFCFGCHRNIYSYSIPKEKMYWKYNHYWNSRYKREFSISYCKKTILLKVAVSYGMFSLLLCSLFNIALPVLFTQNLGFPEDVANRLYGYSQGAIAIGSVLGGLLSGAFSHRLKAHTISYNIVICALCILVGGITLKVSLSPIGIFAVLTLCCSLLMLLSTIFQIQMMSYIQILTPNDLIRKVISCIICICMCSNPIGQFTYGLIFEHIGNYSYISFCIAAIVVFIMAVICRKLFMMIEDELK